jgi:PAB-dependent poly(A)-specific ribonuclease subunit 2
MTDRNQIPTDHEYVMMKHSGHICAATSNGSVHLLHADDLNIVKIFTTNNVGICDMDARNNYLVTCGWVNRPQGGAMLAGLANVYDLKKHIQLPPIPFHAGAAHVQMHPKMSTTCILASQGGQLQVIDLMNSNSVNLRQANISTYLTALVLAPSGEALAISDADGIIHLWGSPTKLQFAEYHTATLEWGDMAETVPVMDVNSEM